MAPGNAFNLIINLQQTNSSNAETLMVTIKHCMSYTNSHIRSWLIIMLMILPGVFVSNQSFWYNQANESWRD